MVTSPDENNNIKKVYSQVQGDAYGTNTNVVEVKKFEKEYSLEYITKTCLFEYTKNFTTKK